ENCTVSVRVWPAAMVAPSSSLVSATNGPSVGCFEVEIVKSTPPVFSRVKLRVLEVPVTTVPKSLFRGVTTRFGGGAERPGRETATLPPSLRTVRLLVYSAVAIGENVTVRVVEAPGASVAPMAGAPLTEKGAAGETMSANVRVPVPLLLSDIWSDLDVPLA